MRRYFMVIVLCLFAVTALSVPGQAQCLGLPGLQMLAGTSWSYTLSGFNTTTGTHFIAAVGQFTASIGTGRTPGIPMGNLSSVITINLNGTTYYTVLPVGGEYEVDANCKGGTLLLASGTNPSTVRAVRYVFYNGNKSMFLVSVDNDGVVLTGQAQLQ